ncbi:MAG: isoprenylcysteine carboxylmethyltransferase family protein [Spirochaetes bacterium]|nr:isoprenylcysteine carboxylmethyltransferase family protein [Spirochaetota bacterium]
MFLTSINEIINVWANDANKLIVFVSLINIPFLLYMLIRIYKKAIAGYSKNVEKKNVISILINLNVEIIFLLIFISYISCNVGIGQVIIKPIYDSLLRGIGVVLYINGILLHYLLYKYEKNNNSKKGFYYKESFYSVIRHPEYTFLLMIAIGISLMTVNIFGIILCFLVLLPFIFIRIINEEKQLLKKEKTYIDYKTDVPMFLPDIKKLIRHFFIKRLKGD